MVEAPAFVAYPGSSLRTACHHAGPLEIGERPVAGGIAGVADILK
jgi:hypothetical protein